MGCGHRQRGYVNVDLYIDSRHRIKKKSIDVRATKNLIIADANNLPLRSMIFEKVICQQLLEHEGVNPFRLIKELYRVSNRSILIECVHRYWSKRPKFHKNFVNQEWFRKVLPKLGINQFELETIYRAFPHKVFPLFMWPANIRVTITK